MNCVVSVLENIVNEKGSWFEGQNWNIDQSERMIGSIEDYLDVYHERNRNK